MLISLPTILIHFYLFPRGFLRAQILAVMVLKTAVMQDEARAYSLLIKSEARAMYGWFCKCTRYPVAPLSADNFAPRK